MTEQLKEIWNGWATWLDRHNLSDDQRRIVRERLNSCSNCQFAKEMFIKKVIRTFIDIFTNKEKKIKQKVFSGFKCSVCSCPLDQKTLSWDSQCPLPEYKGEKYDHPKRWDRVRFSDDGKLASIEPYLYHSEPNF